MNTRLLALPVMAALSFAAAASYGTATGAATSGHDARADAGVPGVVQTSAPSASPSTSPVGPGCMSLPESGPGSLSSIANEPLATAVSQIPDLSTLAGAVKKAGVAETLNTAKDITVFAPSNDAFNKVPKDQLTKLQENKQELSKVLSYHVVQGRKTPADLKKGDLTTLEGGKLTTSGSGETIKVGDATVVCGDIQTRNATVYIIDSVLKPPS